ncbi:hypothetical protein Tco_1219491 [Tanacetum coccineum]
MNSSTIVSIIHPKNSNGLRKLFQLQKVVPKPLQKGIDNDIYSTVDACPNACEMWKAIERLKQGKAIVNSSTPTYDQEPAIVANDDELSKEKEIDKLMALISLSFKKIYKPTNENLRTSSNTSRANQDNTPRINRGTGYDNQRAVNVVGASENVEKADWRDDTDDEPEDQEVEAHYLYMAKIQEVTLDAADNFGPIFDIEPLQKVQNDNDNYNVFANDKEHLEQPVNDTYLEEQGDTNITIDSLDMSTNGETIDQDDDDLAKEHDLLASLFEKLKCEIDDSKNRNKSLESSNKTLINKLKGEIEDFKTKNKSLESSNNHFKEANNELSKTNQLMFKDLKKFQAELDRYHDVNYTSKMKIDCVKAKGDLMSYKMESQKSLNKHTRNINDLHQMISEMKKVLVAHQETISIMSQEKEAQNKFYKTREDKEIEKVIALENKVKVLDDIVYKIGQSVQIMNMLNRNCKTSFIKPKYLKKTQRANPRLYDIGCYNDNIALMLAPESDKMIRLAQESRSKLSDLIKLFDYENLNNLYHLFVPQREKSPEQRYFSERSKMSRTLAKNENSKVSFNKHMTLLERRMDESILWDQKYKSSKEIFKIINQVVKCERLEKELSKRTDNVNNKSFNELSKRFSELEQHSINLELALQQSQEQLNNDKVWKQKESNSFRELNVKYFEIQDLKAQLQDKDIAISELKKLIEKMKGKSVETKFEKPSVIRQPNAFKSQRQSVLGKLATFSDSLAKTDFSKSKSVTTNNVSNDFSNPVTAQILPQNVKTKQPIVVPISTREPKQTVNQSAATPLKRTVAVESTNQKHRSTSRKQYEKISKTCKWWYCKITPSGYKWKPKSKTVNVEPNVSLHLGTKSRTTNILEPTTLRKSTVSNTPSSSNSFAARRDILFIVDSRCSKHITENVKLLSNFVEQFLGTVKFENDQIAPILGYRDLVQENVTIKRVYYVEGLNHNLLSVGQLCSRGTDLHSITLQDTSTPNPICLMDKASSSMVMASSSFTSILRYHQLAFNA